MMLPRFLAIGGGRDPFGVKRAMSERVMAEGGLRLTWSTPRIQVFSDAAEPLLLAGCFGAILGPLYTRPPQARRLTVADAPISEAIARSRGDWLIAQGWGDYVAFLDEPDGESALILRAPFGDLDCLVARHRGVVLAASDLALLRTATNETFSPDWETVASHLVTEGLRRERTCIAGVEELLWGQRLIVSGAQMRREACWSPWRFANRGRARASIETAASNLRETVISCIAARASDMGHILVMLSGGLDSSILAASLAASGVDFTGLNLTTGDSTGDERGYARLVADALRIPLIEAEHDLAAVDLTRSAAAGLARPIARSFAQATRLSKMRAAQDCDARAVFDGGGGDNLFCSLQSVTPVADRLRAEGPGRGAWRSARDMARLADTSVVTVARKAAYRAWLRSPGWRWPCQAQFLTPEALALAGPAAHRWLAAPRGALPGAAAHVALLVGVENLLETADGEIAERAPLMAQPLVEMCLSLPSWQWCSGGHNRVLAREAFSPLLPREVAWRRSKGTPDGFVAKLYETNRTGLAELLADGLLANRGLIDRDAVLAATSRSGPVTDRDHLRLLRIADVEAWLRSV